MSSPEKLSQQDEEHCRSILTTLMLREDIEPFLYPTEWKQLGLLRYPEIVKQPMDLTTIKNKLDSQVYTSAEKFCSDMNLLLTNTIALYGENDPIGRLATDLYQWFTIQYKTLFKKGFNNKEEVIDEISQRIADEAELVRACVNGTFDDIKQLIEERNLSVNAVDLDGSTPLMGIAARTAPDALEICNYLLDRGADIYYVQNLFSWTALMAACTVANTPIILRLLQIPDIKLSMINHIDRDGYCAAALLAERYHTLLDFQLKGYLYVSQVDAYLDAQYQAEIKKEEFNDHLFSINLPEPSPNEPHLSKCLDDILQTGEVLASFLHCTLEQLMDINKWESDAQQYQNSQPVTSNEDKSSSIETLPEVINSNIPTNPELTNNNRNHFSDTTVPVSPSRSTSSSFPAFSPVIPATLKNKKNKSAIKRLSMSQLSTALPYFSPRTSRRDTNKNGFPRSYAGNTFSVSSFVIEDTAETIKNDSFIRKIEPDSSHPLSSLPASPSSITNPSSRRTSDNLFPFVSSSSTSNSTESSPIALPPSTISTSSILPNENQYDLQAELLKNLRTKDTVSFTLSPFSTTTTVHTTACSSNQQETIGTSQSVSPMVTNKGIVDNKHSNNPILSRTVSVASSSSSSSSSLSRSNPETSELFSSARIPASSSSSIKVTSNNALSFVSIPLIYILLLLITWMNGSRLSVDG